MKNLYLFFATLLPVGNSLFSQTTQFCNTTANVVIYSNYDGGDITINVDQNIPNLKIGIVSYEFARITITGTYAGNVSAVRWAGYNGTNNHCSLSLPYTTSITGVPNNVDTIILYPASTYSNPFGSPNIICNASCNNTTNQGGCNTPDQIVHYFITAFGGTLYYHHTQYGCWTGTYNISSGGNCCIVPIGTSLAENNFSENNLLVLPNSSPGDFHVSLPSDISTARIKVYNMLGEEIRSIEISGSINFSLEGEKPGIYFLNIVSGKQNYSQRIVLTE